MLLVATSLPEFWDPNAEILLLGPWCTPYAPRQDRQNPRHQLLPDPWRDLKRYQTAAQYCRNVSKHLLGELSSALDAALDVKHDAHYWRILLDPWLTYHVEQMYDHYTHVQDAFQLHPDLRTILLDPTCFITPRDTTNFMRLAEGEFFHLQMFSHFISARAPDAPVRSTAVPAGNHASPATLKTLAKRVIARSLSVLAPPGTGEILVSELGLTRDERLRLILKSRFKALPYLGELPSFATPVPVQDARRLGLRKLAARDEFERLFIDALPRHFPTVYLEGHEAARRFTLSRLPRTPRIVFTTVDCHYNDAFKFAAAACIEQGSRLWGYQHGGAYGMADYLPAETFERAINDRYYCWGWSRLADDPKVRDLPHPMLSRGKPAAPGDDVLFVSTSLDLRGVRLSRGTTGERVVDHIERQARFFRSLPGPLRAKTSVRLYRHDWGVRHRERLQELCPEIRFDDPERPFLRSLRMARLAVFDCPMTTFLEALAADIPFLLTFNPDSWPSRPQAQPSLDRLKDAGILFDSPEEAAAQTARIYADPQAWWNEPVRRAAHRAFADTFARSSPDWLDAWLKEIREGLQEKS